MPIKTKKTKREKKEINTIYVKDWDSEDLLFILQTDKTCQELRTMITDLKQNLDDYDESDLIDMFEREKIKYEPVGIDNEFVVYF